MVWWSVLSLILFFTGYALAHSLLASLWLKNRARQLLGPGVEHWYRLAYNLFAIITLLPLFPMIALLPDKTLYIVPAPWRWVMAGGQLLAVVGLAGALLQTGLLRFVGLAQLFAERPTEGGVLCVHGFYGWVRHPLYFFSLLFLWLTPFMTVNLLTAYTLFTIYFYVGSIYEEKRLLSKFGPAYYQYTQQVPRLIPWPGRSYSPANE